MTETTSRTLRELANDSYRVSKDHGFHESSETPETIPTKLMLIVSEISEALESYRDPRADDMVKVSAEVVEGLLLGEGPEYDASFEVLNDVYEQWKHKPKGFDIEIADTFIRLFDLVGWKGIDIDAAIERKQAYNETRPHMHGGRLV